MAPRASDSLEGRIRKASNSYTAAAYTSLQFFPKTDSLDSGKLLDKLQLSPLESMSLPRRRYGNSTFIEVGDSQLAGVAGPVGL